MPSNIPSESIEPDQVKLNVAAARLSISRRQLDRLIARGELPSIGHGRMRRIAVEDIRAWIDRNRKRGR